MKVISEVIQNVPYIDSPYAATRTIRVLLVITGLATGGATNVVLDLARHFNNRPEFELQLVTGPIPPGRTDVTHLAHEMGISTLVVPSLVNRIDPVTNWKAVLDLRRIMVEGRYDIVHTHSSVAGIVGRFAAILAGIPAIVHHVHGWALNDSMSSWTRMLYVTLERLCAKFTDRIVAVSEADIQKGLKQGIASKEKFSLIQNGIDLNKFRTDVSEQEIRAELGLAPDTKVVGMIGRLDEQKNPLDLIRAASIVVKKYPKVQFLIIGDGALRPECEQLITDLNLEGKFFLLGFRSDVARIVPILAVTAMSSLWEGMPLAFLEAMSAGKPIVANDIDGARDVVSNGETGFLVPPHHPQAMAELILTLLQNESLRKKMGRLAQKRSEAYSVQSMVKSVESLYWELDAMGQAGANRMRKFLARFAGRGLDFIPVTGEGQTSTFGRSRRRFRGNFQSPFSERRLLLALGDGMGVFAAQILTLWLFSMSSVLGLKTTEIDPLNAWIQFVPMVCAWFALAWLNDLYHVPSSYVKSRTLFRILVTSALLLGIFTGVFFSFPKAFPLYYYAVLTALLLPAVGAWRVFYTVVFKRDAFKQRVLLLGNGSRAKATLRDIQKRNWSSYQTYQVVGYVHNAEPKNKSASLKYLGRTHNLLSVIDRNKIHEIVVTTDSKLENGLFEALVECQSKGVRVSWMAEFYERLYQRVPVEHMNRRWALYMMQNRAVFSRIELGLKRLMDLGILLLALPALLLVLVPIAVAIKLESPGPVFYRQKRCGRGGDIFTIFKFRTMYMDAEKDGKARWASKGDPRISRVGQFLRKARLDELPQLLNVLRGEMSIVGPRPERPEIVEQLEKAIPFYRMRHLVKPGITGWAQINYEYGNTVHDALMKLQYDFYYVRYWSIWLDLYTLFRTVGVVLLLKGI